MKEYVLGFAFRSDERVLLMTKSKPDWQAYRLNGIGGKMEVGEDPLQAMTREAAEEVDWHARPVDWIFAGEIVHVSYEWLVYVFTGLYNQDGSLMPTALEDEPVSWYRPDFWRDFDHIENLRWLVPLCQAQLRRPAIKFEIQED